MLVVAGHAVARRGARLDHGSWLGVHVVDGEAEVLVELLNLPHIALAAVISGPALLLLDLEALTLACSVEPGHVVTHGHLALEFADAFNSDVGPRFIY